jgi:hypothetical protein
MADQSGGSRASLSCPTVFAPQVAGMYVRTEKDSKRLGRHRIHDSGACLSTMQCSSFGCETGRHGKWRIIHTGGLGEEKVGDKVFAGITIR